MTSLHLEPSFRNGPPEVAQVLSLVTIPSRTGPRPPITTRNTGHRYKIGPWMLLLSRSLTRARLNIFNPNRGGAAVSISHE